MNPLESEALQAFGVFAEHKNFTAAARVLHLSQPSLHVKIQKLARDLGKDLYTRQGRALVLTPDGVALAEFARRQRIEADRFFSEMSSDQNRPLVLACGRGAFLEVIDRGIASALKAGVEIEFVIDNTMEILKAVEEGNADIAVGVFEPVPAYLAVRTLATYAQCVLVPDDHPLTRRRSVRLRDLNGMALAVPPSRWPQRQRFDEAMAEADVDWQVQVEAQGWDLLVRLAELNVAPALVNEFVSARRGLQKLPIKDLPSVRYSVATRDRPNKFVAELIEHLQHETRGLTARLA